MGAGELIQGTVVPREWCMLPWSEFWGNTGFTLIGVHGLDQQHQIPTFLPKLLAALGFSHDYRAGVVSSCSSTLKPPFPCMLQLLNMLILLFFFLGGGSPQYNTINLTALDWTQLSKKECLKYGGSLVGKSCKFVPDLALMSFILFFGTYSMTLTLKKFKFSRYFPTKVRKEIALQDLAPFFFSKGRKKGNCWCHSWMQEAMGK